MHTCAPRSIARGDVSPPAPTRRATEFDATLDAFCDEWNRGTDDQARFEKEYLLAIGRVSGTPPP